MATWAEFEQATPEIAAVGLRLFRQHGLAYLATAGEDGRPYVHPVVPLIAEGRLFVFVALGTPKERNLRRDGRYAMHAVVGKEDEEFLIWGRAAISDNEASPALARRAADEIGMTSKDDVLMEFHIERAHWATWKGLGTPDIRRTAKRWRRG
jgi:hypothetical protein